MGMFDSYNIENNSCVPCNLFKFLPFKEPNIIITGVPNKNTFHIPFDYYEGIEDIEVSYKQFDRLLFTFTDVIVETSEHGFFIIVNLTKEQSNLFGNTLLNTKAQVKFKFGDEYILSEIIPIKILQSLNDKEEN